MEGLIFSEDLCRLCLWRSNKLFPIFSQEGELQGIPLKIEMCLPISVTREDVLPKLICSQCIYKLEMFSEFRNSCVRSEQILKRYTSCEAVEVPRCHAIVVQMQEEVKVEVQEPDPIAVEQEIPFFCIMPDNTCKEAIVECERPEVENDSVNSISTNETKVENSNKDATLLKKRTKRNQKVIRQNPALKKSSNKSKLPPVCRDHQKYGPTRHRGSSHVAHVPALTSSKRAMHRCKHCSKHFPSRVQLSQHLTSSNCLFLYTCRYCAKIFGSAENRIHHERNHRDKKNFICRICKQKFQSSFDLNVHTLQGCERSAIHNHQQSTVVTEGKGQMTQEKGIERMDKTKQPKDVLNKISDAKVKQHFKCKYCKKDFTHMLPYKKHIRTCRRVMTMTKFHEIRRKTHIKPTYKSVPLKLKQDSSEGNQETEHEVQRVVPDSTDIKASSRRKQNFTDNQEATTLENLSEEDLPDISLKASLLAVLGLKEKSKPADLKATQKEDEMKMNKTNVGITEDEVVTVCDICRKIFTSESGMLNHQTTVHNRNLTAEKINSLMRVEI